MSGAVVRSEGLVWCSVPDLGNFRLSSLSVFLSNLSLPTLLLLALFLRLPALSFYIHENVIAAQMA